MENRGRADFHLHSRFSDGSRWPEEIAAAARCHGLDTVSLTDHDTLNGTGRFREACRREGVKAITGVEIDCATRRLGFDGEILAYFPGSQPRLVAELLEERTASRFDLARRAIEKAAGLYRAPVSFGEFCHWRCGGTPTAGLSFTKADVWRYLSVRGVVCDDYQPFKQAFFADLKEELGRPDALEIISLVRADGGFPVLAHPWKLVGHDAGQLQAVAGIAACLAAVGLWGVELHPYDDRDGRDGLNAEMARLAAGFGLACTYGSDCHGPGSGREMIGTFSGVPAGFN